MLQVIQKLLPPYDNLDYILYDDQTMQGIIVDASEGAEILLDEATTMGVTIDKIVLTHTHFDHIIGLPNLLNKQKDLPVFLHPIDFADIDSVSNKHAINDGDTVAVGNEVLQIMHTPGHKPGSICIYNEAIIVTGDTVFIQSHGRTDLPGGDLDELRASFVRLRTLPDHLILYPGHAYNGFTSTLGAEKYNL